ncbi:MAG: hypothetical protein L0H73_08830 [Nitrococcus sp.]|nr:hypothetical protein [Nitrococcus sp.]
MAIDRLPWREALGQLAPVAPRLIAVQDRNDDAAQLVDPSPCAVLGQRAVLINEAFEQVPLLIR